MKKIIRVIKMNVKKGFTLIELVVAMAIFFIIIAVAFTSISRFYMVRTFYDQQMVLQQNFLYAMDKLSDDLRQATLGGTSTILKPEDKSMEETVEFNGSDGGTITYDLESKDGGKTYAIYRNSQPVTENMHQLVKLYFIRQGGRVIAIIVGKATYMGTTNTVSFTSLIYSRNYLGG
jgi:prepilin-type N-terminal cleavage/methylation domain-containing protein